MVSGSTGSVLKLTTRLHLELGLRTSAGMPPLPHMPSQRSRGQLSVTLLYGFGSDVLQADTVEMRIVLGWYFETDTTASTQTPTGAPARIRSLSFHSDSLS